MFVKWTYFSKRDLPVKIPLSPCRSNIQVADKVKVFCNYNIAKILSSLLSDNIEGEFI